MSRERDRGRYVAVARVIRPHGVRGEVQLESLSDVPERFEGLHHVTLAPARATDPGAPGEPAEVESIRWAARVLVAKFAGVESVEAAERLRGWYLKVPESALAPLPEGHHYVYQLVGLLVRDTRGTPVGVLDDVWRRPANDVFVVRRPGGEELLVPALASVVVRIAPEAGEVVLRPLDEWL